MNKAVIHLSDEAATLQLAARIAERLPPSGQFVIYLHGELGAGKTSLSRGILQALGHRGAVKSPTYTLIESYAPGGRTVHHLDLYRLTEPEELAYLGLRDLLEEGAVFLIEWPELGAGFLPDADLHVSLFYDAEARVAEIHYTGQNSLFNSDFSTINN
ncbi:MAG: tRNA (adenosine(37)-N6)-threonylcarbamoyltransferase complex ATPase subunit type 1 TsaE [Gammaproteobacteria bacterium]|nr:tRNA (adenosine(37)-N6)-threonylcarbamoyltransferase complex ATPase subunit type 1 TsaE [Gammaproteobacteria bacterium]